MHHRDEEFQKNPINLKQWTRSLLPPHPHLDSSIFPATKQTQWSLQNGEKIVGRKKSISYRIWRNGSPARSNALQPSHHIHGCRFFFFHTPQPQQIQTLINPSNPTKKNWNFYPKKNKKHNKKQIEERENPKLSLSPLPQPPSSQQQKWNRIIKNK